MENRLLLEERTKLIGKLHTILGLFILRSLKVYVELDLPTKKGCLLFVSMDTVQQELYQAVLRRDLMAILEKQDGIE